MPLRTGIWGEDPSSDLARIIDKIKQRGAISRYPHLAPTLSLNHQTTLDLATRIHCLAKDSDTFSRQSILRALIPELRQPVKLRKSTLVLQVDSFDGQIDCGRYPPPPLNYYRYIIETRYWKHVIVVNFGDTDNPTSTLLAQEYPRIRVHKGNLLEKWCLLAHAQQAAIGCSRLALDLVKLPLDKRRVWLPAYVNAPHNQNTSTLPIHINNYFSPDEWAGRSEQILKLTKLSASNIEDRNRWEFTETERCRSFEYCQSCRDTGPTGTLWRKVIASRFDVSSTEWPCPHGWKWEGKPSLWLSLQRKLKLGSAVKRSAAALGVRPCKDCEERGHRWDGTRK